MRTALGRHSLKSAWDLRVLNFKLYCHIQHFKRFIDNSTTALRCPFQWVFFFLLDFCCCCSFPSTVNRVEIYFHGNRHITHMRDRDCIEKLWNIKTPWLYTSVCTVHQIRAKGTLILQYKQKHMKMSHRHICDLTYIKAHPKAFL